MYNYQGNMKVVELQCHASGGGYVSLCEQPDTHSAVLSNVEYLAGCSQQPLCLSFSGCLHLEPFTLESLLYHIKDRRLK
jgi:hypothetical protein